MKAVTYVAVSTLLGAGLISLALVERPNFYSAGVAIEQSAITLAVLVNVAALFIIFVGKAVIFLFFDALTSAERQNLVGHLSLTLTESFFTLSMRREQINGTFCLLFAVYLFLRVFHWISSDRLDFLFQQHAQSSRVNYGRVLTMLLLLAYSDFQLVKFAVRSAIVSPMPMVMFACQFAVLLTTVINSLAKFALNWKEYCYLRDNEDEDIWEPKNRYLIIASVTTDLLKLGFYLAMFASLLLPNGIPGHSIGEIFITMRSLATRTREYYRMVRAKAKLEKDIGRASALDLERDSMCVICREEMDLDPLQSSRLIPKKLPCNHVIHYGCLKNWLERSQLCPTCRRSVFENSAATFDQSTSNNTGNAGNAGSESNTPPNNTNSGTGFGTGTSTDTVAPNFTTAANFGLPSATATTNTDTSVSTQEPTASTTSTTSNTSTSSTSSASTNRINEISVDSSSLRLPPGWKTFRADENEDGSLSIKLDNNKTVKLEPVQLNG